MIKVILENGHISAVRIVASWVLCVIAGILIAFLFSRISFKYSYTVFYSYQDESGDGVGSIGINTDGPLKQESIPEIQAGIAAELKKTFQLTENFQAGITNIIRMPIK